MKKAIIPLVFVGMLVVGLVGCTHKSNTIKVTQDSIPMDTSVVDTTVIIV